MDENNQSLRALQVENSRTVEEEEEEEEEHEDEDDGEEFDDNDDDSDEQTQLSELESSLTPIGEDLRASQSETLAVPSTFLLSDTIEVPMEYTLQRHESADMKDQVRGSHQEALASVIAQAAQAHLQNQIQSPRCASSSSELSPSSVTQSISSAPSPILQEQRFSPVATISSAFVAEVDQQNASNPKTVSALPIVKSPSTDGYNWRKYGQKQVKRPQGSRSYYKCTYTKCYAKKIECCDHSNCVTEIICKGQHNHDPPRKVNCSGEGKLALSVVPVIGSTNMSHPIRTIVDTDPPASLKVPVQEIPSVPEMKRQNSSGCDGNSHFKTKEEHVDEPEPKRRVKKSSSASSGSLSKTGKKPKFVVHAAGDVGITGDGYRWRKYGQKMVKGNPHPRNYYRCTSAGCPVRKHIEMAVDSTTGVIITYKGVHDHDMPVPKKRHPPSGLLVAAASPASMNNLQSKEIEAFPNQVSTTQWSVDTKGGLTGEALNLGGEKAIESARTLLSIGFEIKPC